MVLRYSGLNAGRKEKIIITGVLVIITLSIEAGVYTLYYQDTLYPWLSLVPAIIGGIWFGRPGFTVALISGALYLAFLLLSHLPVVPGGIGGTIILLLTGGIIAVLSDRIRQQREKEAGMVKNREGEFNSFLTDISYNLRDARYCILPYINVKSLKDKKDVRGLVRALTSEDLNIQYDAVEALGDIADPRSVPALIHVLTRDQYSAIRWKAAESLAKVGEPAVDPLIITLGHPDEDVRWKAAIALGEISDPRAIEPLIGLLKDEDNYVKGRTAHALGMIGPPAVIPLIRALKEGDGNLRWGAAIALGKIHDPRAIAPLIQALSDKYENVRAEAQLSLQAMEQDTLDQFIELLNEAGKDEMRDLIRDGIPEEGSSSFFARVAHADRNLRQRLEEIIRTIDDPDLVPLINNINPPGE